MTIYLDIIFLENLFMNYIILFASAIILKKEIKIIRMLISSVIGSLYAIITYINILNLASNTVLKIVLSVVMVYISFDSKTLKTLFINLMIFYLVSFTFGGVSFALLYFINPEDIVLEKGMLKGIYPIKIVIVGGLFGFIIITTAFKNVKGKLGKKDIIYELKISILRQNIFIKAILDTGNFLKEPITKNPVIIVEKQALETIIDKKILANLKEIIEGNYIVDDLMMKKIRIVPYTSLGKENGILLGIKADYCIVKAEDKENFVKNAIIGIYEGAFSKNKTYQALIGLEILESKGEENEYIKTFEN